jgi:TonB family protein
MQSLRNAILGLLWALGLSSGLAGAGLADVPSDASAGDSALSLAICPIVYPLDQTPSDRGFHYTFYGNGFFINDEGYLLTAAHVLSQLNDSTPYIVLRLPMAPPRFLKTEVVAIDREHDVALLRATPNPFKGKYQVRFLPLAVDRPLRMQSVLAAALRPSRLRDPHTFDAFAEDRPSGEVLRYEFLQLTRGGPETELLLFSHEVLLGDSGAPVVSAESQAVVGLVEGRWLRMNATSLAAVTKQSGGGVGAVVPIHYAIPLLQQQGVTWQAAQENLDTEDLKKAAPSSPSPMPLSLIGAAAPAQALQSGEVVLDARIDRNGQLADIQVVQGSPLFAEKALSAARTWSFQPSSTEEGPQPARIGIIFQFAAPGVLPDNSKPRRYESPNVDTRDRASLPLVTTEPEILGSPQAEANIILAVQIDANGSTTKIQVIKDAESLGATVLEAVREWRFIPAKCAGENCASTVFIVIAPRQGTAPNRAQSKHTSHALSQ